MWPCASSKQDDLKTYLLFLITLWNSSKITAFQTNQTIPAWWFKEDQNSAHPPTTSFGWTTTTIPTTSKLAFKQKALEHNNLYSISNFKLAFNPKKSTLQHHSYISSWCPKCNHNFRPIPGEVTHSCFPSSGQQFNRLGSLAPQTTCQLDILKIPSEICLLKFPNFYHICREIMRIYMYIICIVQM